MGGPQVLTHRDYTVGWICALPDPELAAALFMLDGDEHEKLPRRQTDTNNYTLGNIGLHNVVIACLPQGEYGTNSAANVASQMRQSFPNVQFGLMVGIAGGVPKLPEVDIRLGDVVVSKPGPRNGGVIQYDIGKALDGVFEPTGWLNAPPPILRAAIAFESQEGLRFTNPGPENDQLYDADDPTKLVARPDRHKGPIVHYGTIASGNSLIKDGKTRDQLRQKHGICCVEMEAAGLMNNFPCAVIRGICDYADSHKNKQWQPYAAATAAAYAKCLLNCIAPIEVEKDNSRSGEEETCMAALFLTDPRVDRDRLLRVKGSRVDGTCAWIKTNELYKSWLRSRSQLLWLSGGPGKGKTMLSIFLSEELELLANESQDVLFLQYFCDNKEEKRNTATAIMRGLLFQVLSRWRKLFSHILPGFRVQKESLFSNSSFEALWRIFESMVNDPVLGTTYCVLDGLDECEEASLELLLEKFKAFFSKSIDESSACRLKLIAVSRGLPDFIPELLSSFPHIKLDPDADKEVNSDIRRFIDFRVDELSARGKYPETLRLHVKHVFSDRAENTFLWVGIVANELRKYKLSEIEAALELFPSGLDGLYARMLLQISDGRRDIAAKILRWVVMAVRPLTVSELGTALETSSRPSASLSCDEVMRDQLSFCGYFLTIKEDEVGLIHQSAKDYLLRKIPDSNHKLEFFRVKAEHANSEIVQKCLAYLQNGILDNGPISLDDDDGLLKDVSHLKAYSFLAYAALCWPEHARSLVCSEDIFDLSSPFLKEKSIVRDNWLQTYFHHRSQWNDFCCSDSSSLLHIASHFGIASIVKKLLSKRGQMNRLKLYLDLNRKANDGSTALYLASISGHEVAARLLIEKGARVNAKDKYGSTVLRQAAIKGHKGVVQLLLEKGAAIGEKDKLGRTALHQAVFSRNEATVQLLLEKGAGTEEKDKLGQTALHCAAVSGNEAMVRLLLEKGARIEEKDKLGQTALHCAAMLGNEATVQLLLEKGAGTEEKDKRGNTALHCAAAYGNEAAVRLLLEKGAGTEEKDKRGKTALHCAAMLGNEATVQLLLEKGAGTEEKDKRGKTALHRAAVSGNEATVRLLLEKGAGIEERDKEGQTVLHCAAFYGYEATVRLLLEKGATLDTKNKDGNTALDLAIRYKRKATERLLVEKGVKIDVNEQGEQAKSDSAATSSKQKALERLSES